MEEAPKHVKRAVRELAGRAHEIELGRELTALQQEFARWQRGEISALDVSDAIHRFHEGPARELWARCTNNDPTMAVAFAIDSGILGRAGLAPAARSCPAW